MKSTKSVLRISLALALLAFASCSKSLYDPTAANVSGDVTLEQLKEGKALYTANCNRCHSLYTPKSFTREQWTKNLNRMQPKAKITEEQKAAIYSYLTHNPKRKK
jgi:mono/diheme cytochrome c family protein